MTTTISNKPVASQPPSVPNLGPGELISQGSNVIFVLSRPEWYNLQVYVDSTLLLPTSEEAMRKLLQAGKDEQLPDFGKLLNVYGEMNKHCTKWKNQTFPASVSIADDVVHYNTQASVFYAPLRDLAAALRKNPRNQEAQQEFKELVDELASQAAQYARKAQKVEKDISEFAANSANDREQLSAVNTEYDQRFGDTSAEGLRLKEDLAKQYSILDEATKEYNQATVIAATTPTYAWVNIPPLPPIGMIISIVIAGVYGDRAVKAKQRMDAAHAQIKKIGEQLSSNAAVIAHMARAGQGLDTILLQLTEALPVIQKIRDTWTGITADLTQLSTIIEEDIDQALPVLKNLGIDAAIEQWAKAGKAAERYRLNAFIEVKADESKAV
jgi:hypothetical protein